MVFGIDYGQSFNQTTSTVNEIINNPVQQSNTMVNELPKQSTESFNNTSQTHFAPTVEQSAQEFINTIQNTGTVKKETKKDGVNYVFIIILFLIVIASIYFLFPLLLNYI